MTENPPHRQATIDDQRANDQARLELLDLLLEAAADGFLDWRLDEGTVFYSARFRAVLGYEDQSLSEDAHAWLGLVHPDDRVMATSGLEDLIAGDWPFDLTLRMKHRVVGWRCFRVRAAANRESAGKAVRVVVTFGDVTSQVRAERRQMSLLNAIPDLLLRVQSDSTVVDVKIPEGEAEYARGVPQPGETLCGSPFAGSWSGRAGQAISNAVERRTATCFEGQLSPKSNDTESRDIEVRVFPSAEEEAILVVRDVTAEKRQREQGVQSQKLEAIGQLASGIAHEINTPLQFVGDNLYFMAEASDALATALKQCRAIMPAELLPALDSIESSLDIDYMIEHLKSASTGAIDGVQRVSIIVQAMKAFTHPGSKEKRAEDLNHALETTLTLSTNVWKYVADIEREFSPDLPKVDCVIGEINQVFLNLITNAAHAIGDVVGNSGTKRFIRITTQCDGATVEVRIIDSGSGIPDSVRERIFEPFFTTKEVGRGTGQGLPLARAIVQQHRGSLTFETIEGKGTTFIIRLPITANTDSTRGVTPSQ